MRLLSLCQFADSSTRFQRCIMYNLVHVCCNQLTLSAVVIIAVCLMCLLDVLWRSHWRCQVLWPPVWTRCRVYPERQRILLWKSSTNRRQWWCFAVVVGGADHNVELTLSSGLRNCILSRHRMPIRVCETGQRCETQRCHRRLLLMTPVLCYSSGKLNHEVVSIWRGWDVPDLHC